MLEHSSNMNIVVQKIIDFYNEHELESDEIIGWLMYIVLIDSIILDKQKYESSIKRRKR
jgi:hypothetical protein